MTPASLTRENLARAAVEGLLRLLGGALEAIRGQDVEVRSVSLIGGGSRSLAVRAIAPDILGVTIDVPEFAEYVALGAARQAAAVLSG